MFRIIKNYNNNFDFAFYTVYFQLTVHINSYPLETFQDSQHLYTLFFLTLIGKKHWKYKVFSSNWS